MNTFPPQEDKSFYYKTLIPLAVGGVGIWTTLFIISPILCGAYAIASGTFAAVAIKKIFFTDQIKEH